MDTIKKAAKYTLQWDGVHKVNKARIRSKKIKKGLESLTAQAKNKLNNNKILLY